MKLGLGYNNNNINTTARQDNTARH